MPTTAAVLSGSAFKFSRGSPTHLPRRLVEIKRLS
jgi:hypothetical protein